VPHSAHELTLLREPSARAVGHLSAQSRWRTMRQRLEDAQRARALVRIYRLSIEDEWLTGYVTGIGPQFFVVQLVADDINYDGCVSLRFGDVAKLDSPDNHFEFVERALDMRSPAPLAPDVDLSSLPALLNSAYRCLPGCDDSSRDLGARYLLHRCGDVHRGCRLGAARD
jgi:hypothetical protein